MLTTNATRCSFSASLRELRLREPYPETISTRPTTFPKTHAPFSIAITWFGATYAQLGTSSKMASQPAKQTLTGNASQSQRASQPGLRYPSNGKTIYHRPLNRSRTQELSQASFAYLFGEMVSYAQKRVTGIQDLEKR